MTNTTLDPPESILVTLRPDGDSYIVSDLIGTRYGHSTNPLMALIGWWWQVQDLLDMDEPVGDPIATEIRRYRQALGQDSA